MGQKAIILHTLGVQVISLEAQGMKRRMSTQNLPHFMTVLHHDCCLGLTQICVLLCAGNKIFMLLHVCVFSPDSRAKAWASSSNPDP